MGLPAVFLSESKIEAESDYSPLERFERYCDEVESKWVWGVNFSSVLTLTPLSNTLIFSGFLP